MQKRLMKKYSILQGLLLVCILATAIPVISSVVYYTVIVSGQLAEQSEKNAAAMADQLSDNLIENMTALNNTAYFLMSNKLVQEMMSEPDSYAAVAQMENQINAMLTYNTAWNKRFIQSLYLFRQDGSAYAALRESVYAAVRKRNTGVFEEYTDFTSTKTLVRPHGSAYCYYIQDYYQIDIQKKLGKLIIECDPEKLVAFQSGTSIYENTRVFLLAKDGRHLYSYSKDNLSIEEDKALFDNLDGKNNNSFYHIKREVDKFDLVLHLFIPYSDFMAPVTGTRTAYILMEILILSVSLLLFFLVYYKLRQQVTSLQDRLTLLSQGDFSVRLPPSNFAELNLLSQAFNNTSNQLGELFHQVYETGLLLNQAEYQMLESQINPHFIMNVLETINMRCRLAGQTQTGEMVVNLGMLLRSNVIFKKKKKITLRQELDYVRYYLELQKARFDSLQVKVDVEDDELLDCYLPKLTIQPIVENSFVHGLEHNMQQGKVRVSVWEEEGSVCVRVEDNGRGFDSESLDLSGELSYDNKKNSHIALKNIQRRIELLYGTDFGIQIQSNPGRGTSVLVTLPLDMNPDPKTEDADDV